MMNDKELYRRILGVEAPWEVSGVELDLKAGGEIRVYLDFDETREEPKCPVCGEVSKMHDRVERRWRHLDTCQYKTIIIARVPRIDCPLHKVKTISVPWAEKNSRLTKLFERLVIDWLGEASIAAVAEHLHLGWSQIDGVMQRAVRRGLKRRKRQMPERLGVDETSFQKRHEYVTVVTDPDEGTVIDVVDDRRQEPLEKVLKKLGKSVLLNLKSVAMDMHAPFIAAVKSVVPDAGAKIAFDKFHVIAHLTKAVNQVRIQENQAMMEDGSEDLKGTRFLWITAKENLSDKQADHLAVVKRIAKKTSKAWRLKEIARDLWCFTKKHHALKAWKRWCYDVKVSGLAPMQRVADMVLNHLQGIIMAILLKVTNARGEALNNKIQNLKRRACGFRNRVRFKHAILFHLGGLDLYPA